MNLVVIGTGMYVSGRGTDGFGTILPAIVEWKRNGGALEKVFLVGSSRQRGSESEKKFLALQARAGVEIDFRSFPNKSENNPECYIQVLGDVSKPACSIVAVPDHLHYRVTKACLAAGHHTLVVKPLTPTVTEGKKLIDLAKANQLYGAVEFHKRWDRQIRILRDEIQSGNLGVPLYTWTEYSQRKSIPAQAFQRWVEKTNILQYLGVHYIDVVRFATGASPVRVLSIGQNSWLKGKGIDALDAIQCLIEWVTPQGALFSQTLLVNWVDPENSSAMSDQKIKFVGTCGRYEGDQKERGVRLLSDQHHFEEPNPDFCRPYQSLNGELRWEGYGIDSIVSFLDDVSKILSGKRRPLDFEASRPTFSEALVSTAVVEAANRSLENANVWQEIPIVEG